MTTKMIILEGNNQYFVAKYITYFEKQDWGNEWKVLVQYMNGQREISCDTEQKADEIIQRIKLVLQQGK